MGFVLSIFDETTTNVILKNWAVNPSRLGLQRDRQMSYKPKEVLYKTTIRSLVLLLGYKSMQPFTKTIALAAVLKLANQSKGWLGMKVMN